MWIRVVISAILLLVTLETVSGQKCPYGWYGYSTAPNSKCYRFVYSTKLTWQDARNYCQVHGGDLLKIESSQEMTWTSNQLRAITQRNHLRNPLWWTGLNNREYLTMWEWADGTQLNARLIKWRPGEPNNFHGQEGCAEITGSNTFNDARCSNNYFFVCNRARSKPLACDTDRGWQTINGQCYKLYNRPNSWNQAKAQCSHDGGALATVDSQQVELAMHELAASIKKPVWIGLHSIKVSATAANWIWTNGTQLATAYWHGSPHVARNLLNSSCAYISNTLPASQDWTSGSCNTPRAFVCQKPEGVCFPGWVGHASNCYQFDPQYRLNFAAAVRFCSQQGAELLRIDSSTDEMFVQSYEDEMKDSGASTFWIGLSDDNHDGGPFKWRNGRPLGRYTNWITRTPVTTKGHQDCVYMSTGDTQGKWRTTTACQAARSVVCRIPMNQSVKPIARTPSPHYGCPANWRLYQTTCYRVGDRSTDQITARGRCQQQHGADLAVINSADAQGFVNRLVRRNVNYYIGLNDRAKNGVYVWNDNAATLAYTNWKPHEPNDHGGGENCVVLNNNQWNDFACQAHAQYICSMSATNVINPSTPVPTVPVDWTVKCGPGWESNPTSNYCYLFSDQQLSWADAQLQCRSSHGSLVSIESPEEQSYLAGRLSSLTSLAVWTGANDRQTEGGWRWANNDPFAYLNWAPGQPGGNRGQGSDCVIMLTNTAQWDDVRCDARNGYVCKKMGNVPTTTTHRTTAVSVPAGKKIGCRFGWRQWGGACYAFIKRSTSWDNAYTFCRSIGADLVSINSRGEQNFIQGVKPRAVGPYDAVWIGLNDKAVENRFQWSDGSPVAYTNWNTNEPNNWMNRNEDCVDVSLKTGRWNDEVCSVQKQGVVCKRPLSLVPLHQSPPPFIVGCVAGSFGFGSYCYKIVQGDSRSWASANSKCNSSYHGTLATVNDRFLQSFLSSLLVRLNGNFWIGLTDTSNPGTYSWASGHALLYTAWGQNHTGNEQSTCVAMSGQLPVGLWVNLPCQRSSNYICQLPRRGYTPPPTPGTPFPNVPCPLGWTENYAYCIRVFSEQSIQKNWMDAVAFCQGMGGDLASFHTKGNDTAAIAMVKGLNMTGGLGAWIGLNDRDTEGGHKWSDGSPLDYTNWNRGEPNNYQNSEDCVDLTSSGGWNDLNCYFQLPFICALPRGTTPITTLAPPVAVNSVQCGSSPTGTMWFLYNNNCYLLSPTSGGNTSVNYYTAMAFCRDAGAALASVHSEPENGLLTSKIHTLPPGSFWIGLNKLDNKDYRWTDGTPLDYVSWNKNQPDDYQGSERCAEIFKWSGMWNDDLCSNRKGFICKKPLNGVVHVVPPSPNTPGGCPNGFAMANGGRNKCFYIARGVQRNWTAAYTYCRSLGSHVDIASVEDAFEDEFLITLAGSKRGSLWIGMNAHRGKNNFYWQDGSPVVYTNWDANEPTSAKGSPWQKGNQNCVIMRMYKGHEGKWADVPCAQNFSFVCQVKQDPNVPRHPLAITGSCHAGYQFYNGNCYSAKATLKSWPDAAADCKADGANLVSISDVFELAFVGTIAFSRSPYWIGLSDLKSPGLYYWNDGSRVVYVNWAPREPSYGQTSGNGCVVSDNQGNWNDTNCINKHYYVCKITTTTIPPTQPAAAGSCPNPQWSPFGDYCYSANVNTGRSWPESNFLCQQQGMQLASVHSKAEMDFVFNLVKSAKVTNTHFTPNIWLGLSKSSQGAFAWSDGTPTNYLNWAPSEPTALGDHGEAQECVEFDRTQETWVTTNCYSNIGYVCKKPKAYATPPVSTINVAIDPNWNPVAQQQQQQQQGGGSGGSHSSSGPSGGTIAGAVLGSIFGVLVLAFLVLYLIRSGKLSQLSFPKSKANVATNGSAGNDITGFENTLYNKSNDDSES